MKITLTRLEELQTTLPQKAKPQYNGCLSPAERQLMADIYKDGRIAKISKRPASKFNSYRKEFA